MCILVGSDIRDARSQDPVARRRLADLIRDACINVRSRPCYLIITFIYFTQVGFFYGEFAVSLTPLRLYGMTGVSYGGMFISSSISWDS